MVNFKVGDDVVICASIDDVCGAQYNLYHISDINISIPSCSINIYPFSCLEPSGIQLEFQWVNSRDSGLTHTCNSSVLLKLLGTATTDSDGKASINYKITQNDLDLFNANTTFELRACITSSVPYDSKGKVRNEFHLGDYITISSNPCLDVICNDICIGSDLWSQKCNPATGLCIQDSIKYSGICPVTHYIEFDFSFLPTTFTDFILSNITSLSNWLFTHLPTPPNIIYKKAVYGNGKFGIYVQYTSPSSSIAILDTSYVYDVEYLSPGLFDWITTGAELLLDTYARVISTIIIFLIAGQFAIEFGLVIGIVALVIATVVSAYIVKDIGTGSISSGTSPESTPQQKVEIVKEFLNVYVDPAADNLTPQCACPASESCTVSDMLFYLSGRATARYAQCIHAHENENTVTTFCTETVKNEILNIKSDLTNGIITVQEACNRLENNIVIPVKEDVEKVIKRLSVGACWIPSPLGGCILSASTGKKIVLIGGLIIGGYIAYDLFVRKK